MIFLIDMNLSPTWVAFLSATGYRAVHWSSVGEMGAPDLEIAAYARTEGMIVLTHDLDFDTILAMSKSSRPSVLQVRTRDTLLEAIGSVIVRAVRQFETELISGAIVTVDAGRAKARLLPLSD